MGKEVSIGDVVVQEFAMSAIVWECGQALADYFLWQKAAGQIHGLNMNVLELGAGTGATSLVLASLGATVVATDYEPRVLENLRQNIHSNKLRHAVQVHELSWAHPTTYLASSEFDLIVAADVLYGDRNDGQLFLQALEFHLQRHAKCLLAFTLRDEASLGFFNMAYRRQLQIHRLEDGLGRVVGGTTFEGRFVRLEPHSLPATVKHAEFVSDNLQEIQIFRITWDASIVAAKL